MPDPSTGAIATSVGDDAAMLTRLNDIVRDLLEDRSIALQFETSIDDLTAWDSMHHIAIMVEVECRFDVLFEPEELDQVPTVGHLIRLIQAKQPALTR